MLLPALQQYRRRRGRPKPPAQAAAAVALTLVQAELIFGTPMVLRLRFDRAIDIAGLVAGQITVQDPVGDGVRVRRGGRRGDAAGCADARSGAGGGWVGVGHDRPVRRDGGDGDRGGR